MKPQMRFFTFILLILTQGSLLAQEAKSLPKISPDSTTTEIKKYVKKANDQILSDYYKGDYNSCIFEATTALKLANKAKLTMNAAAIRSHLSNAYLRLKDSVKAIEYTRENIKLGKRLQDTSVIVAAQIDLGNIYSSFDKLEQALAAYKKVISLAKLKNDKRRLFILNYNIAEIYLEELKDQKKAKPYLENAEAFIQRDIEMAGAGLKILRGHYYYLNGNYEKASLFYQDGIQLSQEVKYSEGIEEGYSGYINCLAQQKDFKKAYEVQKLKDSIDEARRDKEIEKSAKILTVSLKNARVQEKLKNKDLRNKLIQEKAETNKKLFVSTIIVAVLLLSFLIFLLIMVKKRRTLNRELKKKNKKYLNAKRKSEKLSKAKSKFLSTISHELRTPLYGIIGLSTALNEDKSLKSHKSELESLKFSAEYLLNLVNDILTLNKMESGFELENEIKSFDLRDFLNHLAESMEFISKQTKNDLKVHIDPAIPSEIKGDSMKLSQILINLVGNALKFTEEGLVQLSVDLVLEENNSVSLRFEVKDNGPGIPTEKQKLIFKEFGQLRSENHFHGTGLGLNIVQKLVKSLGSTIQLESVPGEGSCFYFTMDFEKSEADATISDLPVKPVPEILADKRVLIVDDNHVNLLVTQKTVENHGMTAAVAVSGQQAIDMIKENPFDIVLMDINMPGMDGIEATKRIRSFNNDVRIIALTAVTLDELGDRIKGVTFSDAVLKPYRKDEFLQILAKNLNSEIMGS